MVEPKMQRSASSSAVKPRTAWCPVILKGKNGFEMHIMWKDTRNMLELFKVKGKDKVKRDFGLVASAKVVNKNNDKGEANDYFVVINEYGDVVHFKSTLLNPGMMGSNSFSKQMIGIRAASGDAKLAKYISQLARSKDFGLHDPNVYTNFGLENGKEQ